jgi:hypothetical protein
MRKFIILIMTLGICGVLSGEGWAAKIRITGVHTPGAIQGACDAAGGDFFSFSESGRYGCFTDCLGNGDANCAVDCVNGACTGSCPRCGGRQASRRGSPLPRLRGAHVVTRVLNNFRPAKRYPAKRY